MVYIYKKTVGSRSYYYLRASVKKGKRILTKDIAYLGKDISEVKQNLEKLPVEHSEEIRKAYKVINRFIQSNHFLEKAKQMKLKSCDFMPKELLENVEACRLHWNNVFAKDDKKTKEAILKNFIIEFAFNTASIEGNTITLNEAQKLLSENLTPKNRTLREIFDLQNTEKVFLKFLENPIEKIDHELICMIHDSLLENIDDRKGYRTQDVRVFKSNFDVTPAPYVLADMNLLLKQFTEKKEMMHPLALAVIFHHKFEKIHPFMDGNGRTGRMLMNLFLMSSGFPPIVIRRLIKPAYISALNKADKSKLDDFSPNNYKLLVEMAANEMISGYWSMFL